jgi:hypothetical protein
LKKSFCGKIFSRVLFHIGRAGHLGKSISFFDPERDSDRKIAPDLVSKLSEV